MSGVTFAEPFGFKFLDPTGCTYYDGELFQYNLPQRGEKWGQPTMHPEPGKPDGEACGAGRLHQMKGMGAQHGPANWWPWWSRGIAELVGQDEEKRGWHGLELRRISPQIFARCLRPPFNWGHQGNLSWVNLYGADLHGADLYGAVLRGADLSYANLRGVDFRRADLCRANLREANLSWSNLYGVDLREVNLSQANLYETNLREAALTNEQREDAEENGAILD